jgi:pimeloyl-ACP methyl ester carboxylesterase/nitrogen fixation protein FixH
MLPTRSLLAAACAAAGLAPCGQAAAASLPVTPVVTGGKVTYSGGVSGALRSSSPSTDEYYNENAALDFSQVSYAGDLYGGGLSIFDDGGASQDVKTYTAIPGSGSVSARFRHWDPTKGYTWENLTCKNGGRSITPPAPAQSWGGKLNPGAGVGFVDFTTDSTCSKASNSGHTGSGIGSTLVGVVGSASIPVGGTAPTGASRTFDVSFAEDAACPPNGLQNCRYSYSGEGHAKVECAICLTSVELEQHDVRTGNLEPVPATGTIDGNRVLVTATFTNASPYTVKGMVNWRERVGRRKLIDAGLTAGDPFTTFPAGATKKVTFEWDTSGFAWEKGKPASDRELEIRSGWGGGFVKVKVLPKPVVAVHGWNADHHGWDVAKSVIPAAVHPGLAGRVYAVGDENGIGIMDTDPESGKSIAYNATQEATYIQSIREKTDAEHVDLVVHSMGGLISRYYIQKLMPEPKDWRPMVSHLVMLGTPNMGSPCADVIGMVAKGIPTQQLKPSYVEGLFNQQIADRRMVPFSLMAGDFEERTCTSPEHGDLVVALSSAWWTLSDVAKTYAQHIELTDLEAIYASFVKPRIGQDPDQVQNLYQQGGAAARASSSSPASRSAAAATRSAAAAGEPADLQAGVARTVTVPAGGSVDVPIAVGTASALSVGTTAPANVAATLRSPAGAVVDTVAAGSVAARSPMRFQRAESPAPGTWTLRLSQTGGSAVAVGVVGSFEGSPLVLKASRDGDRVRATLRDGGTGVPGATVVAELRAEDQATRTVTLKDDGAGAYSATVALPDGEWFGSVHATSDQGERFAALAAGDVGAPGDDAGTPAGGGGAPAGGGSPSGASAPSGGVPSPGARSTGAGSPAPAPGARPLTVTLSLAAKKARLRRAPYAFALSGRLAPAKGAGCPTGARVMIALTSGRRTVAKTTVSVTARCAFTARVRVSKKAKLRATAMVLPSAKVAAAVSRPLALRAG